MSVLIEALASLPTSEVVRRSTLDGFLTRHPRALLFFTGDVVQRPEGLDVAIVVRELMKKYSSGLALGIVDRRDETALMTRTGVVVLPALAYLADGKSTEVVARMRDWAVYAAAVERLLAAGTPSE